MLTTGQHRLSYICRSCGATQEGLYTISVTPMSDVSGLAPYRTELELTYLAK